MRVCTIPGCGRRYHARGLCSSHYTRLLDKGNAGVNQAIRHYATEPFQFAKAAESSPPLEREEQQAVVDLLRGAGFKVRVTSQKRQVRISPGFPDVVAHHRARGLFLWFEVKQYRPNGYPDRLVPRALEPAQKEFREDAIACGQRHEYGGRNEARAYLESVGILKAAA